MTRKSEHCHTDSGCFQKALNPGKPMKNALCLLNTLFISYFLSCFTLIEGAEKKVRKRKIFLAVAVLKNQSFSFDPETKLHTCKTCGYEKKKLSHMKSHVTIHSSDKPHRCDHIDEEGILCPLTGKRPDIIRRHQRECHQGSRGYVCSWCEGTFKRKEHLEVHCRQHQTQPLPNEEELEIDQKHPEEECLREPELSATAPGEKVPDETRPLDLPFPHHSESLGIDSLIHFYEEPANLDELIKKILS